MTVFDAASWNGIAIDSTCGGHGTCKKCRIRIVDGWVPVSRARHAGVRRGRAGARLAAGLPISRRRRPRHRSPAARDAPEGRDRGVGRQVILRPGLQKRYLELSEPPLDDQRTDFERVRDALDDLELRAEIGVLRRLPRVLRQSAGG